MIKVGFVNYLNSFPIYQGFPLDNLEAKFDNPRIISELLIKQELDLGQISIFKYLQNREKFNCLDHFCIACKKDQIDSVLFFSEYQDLSQIKEESEILVTNHSTASFNLLKVILEKFYKLKPKYKYIQINEYEQHNLKNFLVIGDLSFELEKKTQKLYRFDLAKLWYQETKLPFVFSVFVENKRTPERLQRTLLENLNKNLSNLNNFSKQITQENFLSLSAEKVESYLNLISYNLEARHHQSIRLFESLLPRKK